MALNHDCVDESKSQSQKRGGGGGGGGAEDAHCRSFMRGCLGLGREGPAVLYSR